MEIFLDQLLCYHDPQCVRVRLTVTAVARVPEPDAAELTALQYSGQMRNHLQEHASAAHLDSHPGATHIIHTHKNIYR